MNPSKQFIDTYLDCPYSEKGEVKALGAKWDSEKRKWYVPAGISLGRFTKWLSNEKNKTARFSSRNLQPKTKVERLIKYWLYALEYNDPNTLIDTDLKVPMHVSACLEGKIFDENFIKNIIEAEKGLPQNLSAEGKEGIPLLIAAGFFQEKNSNKGQVLYIIPVMLDTESGSLSSIESELPRFNNAYLEPQMQKGSQLVVGDQVNVDKFLQDHSVTSYSDWEIFIRYAEDFFEYVAGGKFNEFKHPNYDKGLSFQLVYPESHDAKIINLQALYRVLSQKEVDKIPLFKRLCLNDHNKKSLPQSKRWLKVNSHTGHMDGQGKFSREVYPLDSSQREALHHFLLIKEGELQAVNGPPGTGKTSMMRDVIASVWVNATIESEKPECPLIIASAATNQAVTNIIGSFDTIADTQENITVASRWIKQVQTYGWFFPASSQAKKDKWQKYQLLIRKGRKNDWIAGGIAQGLQKAKKEKLTAQYIQNFNNIFKAERLYDLEGIVKKLHEKIKYAAQNIQMQLKAECTIAFDLLSDGSYVRRQKAQLHLEEFKKRQLEFNLFFDKRLKQMQAQLSEPTELYQKIVGYIKELDNINKRKPFEFFFSKLITWFKNKRVRSVVEIMSDTGGIIVGAKKLDVASVKKDLISQQKKCECSIRLIKSEIEKNLTSYHALQEMHQIKILKLQKLLDEFKEVQKFLDSLSCLEQHSVVNSSSLVADFKSQLIESSSRKDFDVQSQYELFEGLLDCTLRVWCFHLTARYWEARWLLKNEGELAEDTEQGLVKTLREFCMLAPCIVATFYSLPKLLMLGNPRDMATFALNSADLLIIDEAGQASSEISAPIFGLSKKAIVVGDIEQLKPVWNFDNKDDLVMLNEVKLGKEVGGLTLSGHRVFGGSVIKMAHNATTYSQGKTGGIMLRQHYRCVPTIIQFSNELVYDGQLIPFRPEQSAPLFYPMSFVECEASVSKAKGSWRNRYEAEQIATWLFEKRDAIESHYGVNGTKVSITDLVAVVTPYSAQIWEIQTAIANIFGEHIDKRKMQRDGRDTVVVNADMTIGTVHSLQGAERPIVIFSSVSTPEQDTPPFIDRDPDMLNVAVSRAKDSFILFGHPQLFFSVKSQAENNSNPSAVLGKYMKRHGKRLYPRYVVAVESPSKAKTISQYLGCDYKVIATVGHFRTLDIASESLDFAKGLQPQWKLDLNKESMIDEFIKYSADADKFILATDGDREGEAIAWHLNEVLSSQMPMDHLELQRIRFSSITKQALLDALSNPEYSLDLNLVRAALSRQIIDYVLGKKLTQELNEDMKGKDRYSIGRVQAALLYLLREREKAISHFSQEDFWTIDVECKDQEHAELLSFYVADNLDILPCKKKFKSKGEAEAFMQSVLLLLQTKREGVSDYHEQVISFGGAPAMTTAQILIELTDKYNMLPDKAMQVMQSLYDGSSKDNVLVEQL